MNVGPISHAVACIPATTTTAAAPMRMTNARGCPALRARDVRERRWDGPDYGGFGIRCGHAEMLGRSRHVASPVTGEMTVSAGAGTAVPDVIGVGSTPS